MFGNRRPRPQARATDPNRERIQFTKLSGTIKILRDPPGQDDAVIPVHLVVCDMSPTGAGLYLSRPMPIGCNVLIQFDGDPNMTLEGRVAWCRKTVQTSGLIKSEKFGYRAGIEFRFKSDVDQRSFLAFLGRFNSVGFLQL